MRARQLVPLLAVLALAGAGHAAGKGKGKKPRLPETPRRPVTDTYHGVAVVEDYRWLEASADPEVKAWAGAQNAWARAYLDKLRHAPAVKQRLTEILTARSPSWTALEVRGGTLFALEHKPPREQEVLVVLPSADEPAGARVVVDPNAIDAEGLTTIDFYVPSHDGKLVAVSLSRGGTEDGTVHVYEVATGKELGDVVPRVNGGTAGGSVAWSADGAGFFYTRYPRAGERPAEDLGFFQQVYYHALGSPTDKDRYELGRDFPRIAEIELRSEGRFVLASVANGDGGEFAHWLRTPAGKWKRAFDWKDKVTHAELGPDGALYWLTLKGAPRGELWRAPLGDSGAGKARRLVPESEAVIQGFEATEKLVYVHDLLGGPSQLRVFDREGREQRRPTILPVSSVGEIVHTGGDDVLFLNQTFVDPPAWLRYGPADERAVRTALATTSIADFSDTEVERVFVTSADGTKVPLNVIKKKGLKLDGKNPTILNGYGGYAISRVPRFLDWIRPWIEQGGVYAVANLRGGGEYGEAWHLAGNLTRKQNVFDDFAACARWLIDSGHTSPKKLAAMGGSNGGLLMGAMITQHPELFRAVVSFVGIYDMLRVELTPNGAFNVTEFGTVTDPDHFQALYAYSPYHHVVDGTKYPAVLFVTGDNDPRVDPWHSRKMTARLQAATGSKAPILLRTDPASGHGGTALSQQIAEDADMYAFLFDQLKVKVKRIK